LGLDVSEYAGTTGDTRHRVCTYCFEEGASHTYEEATMVNYLVRATDCMADVSRSDRLQYAPLQT
jgi:hypothetical protein